MAFDRVEKLKAMVAANAKDSFVRYGLAMEYVATGALQKAVIEFQTLLRGDPKYVAAYYHCGQALEKLGRLDEAGATYRTGIMVADQSGDAHTRDEIQAALDLLG